MFRTTIDSWSWCSISLKAVSSRLVESLTVLMKYRSWFCDKTKKIVFTYFIFEFYTYGCHERSVAHPVPVEAEYFQINDSRLQRDPPDESVDQLVAQQVFGPVPAVEIAQRRPVGAWQRDQAIVRGCHFTHFERDRDRNNKWTLGLGMAALSGILWVTDQKQKLGYLLEGFLFLFLFSKFESWKYCVHSTSLYLNFFFLIFLNAKRFYVIPYKWYVH